MDKKSIYSTLISEYKTAIIRTRNVFVIVNIISIIFLVGYFNYRWTWLRHLSTKTVAEDSITNINENRPNDYLEYTNPGKSDGTIDIREQLLKESLGGDYNFIKFNLTGSKIFIDDLPILGGIALLIVMTWFQYVIRREKGIAVAISKKITLEQSDDVIEYVFYGTVFTEIFNTIPGIDEPNDKNFQEKFESKLLVFVRRVMLFAPSVLLAFIVIHDFAETFLMKNVFENGKAFRLFNYLVIKEHTGQIIEVFVRLFASVLLIAYSFFRTIRIVQLNSELGRHMKIIESIFIKRIQS